MSFLSKLFSRRKSAIERLNIEAEGLLLNSQEIATTVGLLTYDGKVSPEMAAMIYATSPYINACVNTIADYVSSVPLNVYTRTGKNSPKREVKAGEPYYTLQWVNPYMTQSDFLSTVVSWLTLTDNAYIAIELSEANDRKYAALQLFPLNPKFLTLVPDPVTHTKGYIYEVNGKKMFIDGNNMIHIRGFNPIGNWYGLTNLNSLVADIEIERFSKKQAGRFYEQAATVSGVLKLNNSPDPEELIKLKRELQSQYAGGKNAYRVMILSEGMDYEPIKTFGIETQSVPVIEQTIKTHTMVMGVPLTLLMADAENLNDVEALFWNKTLIPICTKIAATLTKKLALPVSKNMTIEFDLRNVEALRVQAFNRARVDIAYVNSGKNTPNEIRASHNEEPYSGDLEEFGNTPTPVWKVKQDVASRASGNDPVGGVSPSLTVPGNEGGRDQSNTGEAQMLDETGTKCILDNL